MEIGNTFAQGIDSKYLVIGSYFLISVLFAVLVILAIRKPFDDIYTQKVVSFSLALAGNLCGKFLHKAKSFWHVILRHTPGIIPDNSFPDHSACGSFDLDFFSN